MICMKRWVVFVVFQWTWLWGGNIVLLNNGIIWYKVIPNKDSVIKKYCDNYRWDK
jgi:hypothetical protein